MQQLSLHLAENLAELDTRFGASADYYAKEIMIYHCRGCIVLFDGMASLDSLWELLLDAASRQAPPNRSDAQPLTGQEAYALILHGSAFPAESSPVQDMPDLVKRLTAGMAVLLLDEITANLDAETEARVLEALRRASVGRTVLSVSHRIYENLGGRTVEIKTQVQ